MRHRVTRVLVPALAVVLVLALIAVAAVVGVRWWRDSHRTELQRAMALAPDDGARFSWTDWAGVRRRLDATGLDASSTGREVEDFLDEGYDADLTSTSAMVESARRLQDTLGFSPANVDWELFTQSEAGAVIMVHLPSSGAVEAVGDQLETAGYPRPDSPTGVWQGGEDLVATIGGLNPELQYVALDAEAGLVLASDTPGYLADAMADAQDDAEPGTGVRDAVDASGSPLSAAVYSGDQACTALTMSQADDSDREQADELIARAGKVNPLAGFAMAVQPDLDVRVALSFETDEQARTNADSRATLAAGPAPGQGGDFADRFTLGDVVADGRVVTMDLRPVDDSDVLSDLSNGPVLFATC